MVLHHFTGGSSEEAQEEQTTSPQDASVCKRAVRDWWGALQKELGKDTSGEKFLLDTTNKLQGNLDIIFNRYWSTEKARSSEAERYISVEQSLRLFDDLVRGNEDVAIPTLKEYLKYKMTACGDENDTVKEKKAASVDAAKKAAGDAFTAALTEQHKNAFESALKQSKKSKNPKDAEIAFAKAKALEIDLGDVEDKVKEVKDARDSEDKIRLEAAKNKETEEKKIKEKNDEIDKAVAKAAEEAGKDKETADKQKGEKEEEAGTKADGDFKSVLQTAVGKAVDKMQTAYNKKTFILRAAACTAFLEGTTGGLSEEEGKTVTQKDLDLIMNLDNGEKFNAFAKALGFSTEDFDAVLAEMPSDEKEEGEEKKEEPKKEEPKK